MEWNRDDGSQPTSPRQSGSGGSSRRSHPNDSSQAFERRQIYDELRLKLSAITEKLRVQERRASDAERELDKAATHLKRMNEARLAALQDAAKAKEELRLYKMQYTEAQNEIFRAQDTIRIIDRQRYDAEKQAVEARTTARKLSQEIMIKAAMEEGRKIGLEEGLKRGRAIALQEAEMARYAESDEDEDHSDDQSGSLRNAGYHSRSILTSVEDVPEPPRAPPDAVTPTSDLMPAPAHLEPTSVSHPSPVDQPRIIRHASPTIYHSHVDIPPDGYIPELDTDNLIRIPPPHEWSPSLPINRTLEQDPPGSVSGRHSPFPAVPEVQAIPIPPPSGVDRSLRHQPSWGGSSARSHRTHRTARDERPPTSGAYIRPRTSSSSSSTHLPVPPRRHSSLNKAPDSNIQSPTGLSHSGVQLDEQHVHVSGRYSPSTRSDIGLTLAGFAMSGEYEDEAYGLEGTDQQPPVIPDSTLYRDDPEDESASTRSGETLTTPPHRHAYLPTPAPLHSSLYPRSAAGSNSNGTQRERPGSRATNHSQG